MDDKMIYKVGSQDAEMQMLHKRAMEMNDSDFKELAPKENILTIWLSDFPQLQGAKAGSDVMFCIRGVIQSRENDGEGQMLKIAMVDASFVHGSCGGGMKKKIEGGLSNYYKGGK